MPPSTAYHKDPPPALSSSPRSRSRGRSLRAGPSMEEPPAASQPRRAGKSRSRQQRRQQRDPSLEMTPSREGAGATTATASRRPTSVQQQQHSHRKLGSNVLRSDDDERGEAPGRVGRRRVIQPPATLFSMSQKSASVSARPNSRHSSRGRSSSAKGERADDRRLEETRQDADDRSRRRSLERRSSERANGATTDAPAVARKTRQQPPDPKSAGLRSKLYEKEFQDRLRTYKQIEKSVNMYKPPKVVRSPDPPPPPKKKYDTKDWSLTSDTTEYQTTSSSGTSTSDSSEGDEEEDAKPPPPSKVYLLKGFGRGRAAAADAESHITMDSGVADYQNSLSTPISTEYRRYKDPDVNYPSPKHRRNLNEWYRANKKQMPIVKTLSTHLSASDDDVHTLQTLSSDEGMLLGADLPNITKSPRNDFKMRQSIAYMAILLTVVQLLVLMLQVALCGAATWDVNPMFGPYPDAFSVWGGKNPYLMLHDDQWWRLITPSFLHVGFLHLLANAFCQLEAIALFEREWGSFRWVLVYVVSSVGCNAFSSLFDENTIAVGSSGALMGLYAAKLAQVCCSVFFDDSISGIGGSDDTIRLDQMSSVLCGLTIVSLLSSFTYIDWSGHMGGLMAGYLAGMVLFSYTIRRCCAWFLWSAAGFLGLVAGLTATIYFFITTTNPYEDLADPCEYFRSLFPEGYVCGCMWQ